MTVSIPIQRRRHVARLFLSLVLIFTTLALASIVLSKDRDVQAGPNLSRRSGTTAIASSESQLEHKDIEVCIGHHQVTIEKSAYMFSAVSFIDIKINAPSSEPTAPTKRPACSPTYNYITANSTTRNR